MATISNEIDELLKKIDRVNHNKAGSEREYMWRASIQYGGRIILDPPKTKPRKKSVQRLPLKRNFPQWMRDIQTNLDAKKDQFVYIPRSGKYGETYDKIKTTELADTKRMMHDGAAKMTRKNLNVNQAGLALVLNEDSVIVDTVPDRSGNQLPDFVDNLISKGDYVYLKDVGHKLCLVVEMRDTLIVVKVVTAGAKKTAKGSGATMTVNAKDCIRINDGLGTMAILKRK